VKYHYFQRRPTYPIRRSALRCSSGLKPSGDPRRGHTQVGSLAGAARLLKNNAGARFRAQ
jgi:hypothetical protein